MSRSSPSAKQPVHHRLWLLVGLAAALYVLILALAWVSGNAWKDRHSAALLRTARIEFITHTEEIIHAVQWCQACYVFDAIGRWTNATPFSVSDMCAIANRLYIDELNIVSSNGIVIASNLPKVVGDNWHNDPRTSEFLEILSPTSHLGRMLQPRLGQSFRHGTVNPEFYCAYFVEAFMDRSGLVELGFSMDRLVNVMAYSNCKSIREWNFGRYGHFMAIDANADGVPDVAPSSDTHAAALETGVLERVTEAGEPAYRLTFSFAGRLFAALVPDREYGDQCRMSFVVFAFTSALLILIFTTVLARLGIARRRVEALRREADARQAQDLAVARQIQLSSLPRAETFARDVLSFDMTAEMQPAREVGGDYYDFFRVSERTVAFVIGDVSGKGVPAALFVQEAKHAFVEALHREGTLTEAVRSMNAALCAQNEAEMFVTAWFGLLDVTTGEVEFVNAGHNRPYVRAADGSVERLDARGGRFIGMFPDATYRASRRTLRPGDRLVLYTDGVTEAMNGAKRPFGDARLVALLKGQATDLVRTISEAVAAYVAQEEPSDDRTLLVVAWNGLPDVAERIFPVTDQTTGEALAFVREKAVLTDAKQRVRLFTAVDEWTANVVSYSGATQLKISVANVPGRCRVVLSDNGVAYDPLAHSDPDTHLALEERPLGGLGILMMKKFVASVTHRREGAWNVLSLLGAEKTDG